MTATRKEVMRATLISLLAAAALALALGAAPARAASAWWLTKVTVAPAHLKPGERVILYASAADIGYESITGATSKVVLTDTVPAGLKVLAVGATAGPPHGKGVAGKGFETIFLKCTESGRTYSCPLEKEIHPAESVRFSIQAEVEPGDELGSTATNELKIEGGETPKGEAVSAAELTSHWPVTDEPVKFEAERFELRPENENGEVETQAGSHPFQLTTVFDLAKTLEERHPFGQAAKLPFLPALPRDLDFTLPPGLVGALAKVPRCDATAFVTVNNGESNQCPADTAIGYASVFLDEPFTLGAITLAVPVFNLVPTPGEPARFGFMAKSVPTVLTSHVRSGSNYAVEVSAHYLPESVEILSSEVTFWGVPGSKAHDNARGWACLAEGYENAEDETCEKSTNEHPQAFLTLPTECPVESTAEVHATAWNGEQFQKSYKFEPFTGCAALPFSPTVEVQPDEHSAATPTGLTVNVKLPQETTLSGEKGALAESAVANTTLTLPVGIQASGGAADGLLTCSSSAFGFNGSEALGEPEVGVLDENDHFNQEPVSCPEAAKIGTVKIKTPLIEEELTGSVYLASKDTNPFGSPLVLYVFAEAPISKVQVKLSGKVEINQSNGQLVSHFEHTPPVAFSELTLHLFNGPRASQSTPEACGEYHAEATFDGSSGAVVNETSKPFSISSGAEGSPCPPAGTQPFAPSFEAGPESPNAGAFSPTIINIQRPNGQQQLKTLTIHEPEGAAALLASVTPCPIAVATQPEPNCPESSRIGSSTAWAGLGSDHVKLPGTVYLTGPYKNGPFGVLDVTDAEHVGTADFNLGKIPVMSTITVNETTAAATITSDPLPERVRGVPSQIYAVSILVNRPNFTFNPTNCATPLAFTATLTGYGPGGNDGSANAESPFHGANCASLPFKPTIEISMESAVSRSTGTGLVITVKSSAGQSNIGKTKLEFPSIIPSRLPTLQKSCPDTTFDANPANCSKESIVGSAIAKTPVLKEPLSGPVYLVSHGGRELPDAEIVLQGEGIKLVLDGTTDIEKNAAGKSVTISSFETVPDAPVETFEVQLPRSTKSAFTGYGDLCTEKPVVETKFTGQNGAYLQEETPVKVTGCKGVLPSKTKKLTELQKNLKTCAKLKSKGKRAKCVASAHKRANAVAACKKAKKGKKAACETTARKKNPLKT